ARSFGRARRELRVLQRSVRLRHDARAGRTDRARAADLSLRPARLGALPGRAHVDGTRLLSGRYANRAPVPPRPPHWLAPRLADAALLVLSFPLLRVAPSRLVPRPRLNTARHPSGGGGEPSLTPRFSSPLFRPDDSLEARQPVRSS